MSFVQANSTAHNTSHRYAELKLSFHYYIYRSGKLLVSQQLVIMYSTCTFVRLLCIVHVHLYDDDAWHRYSFQ